MAVSPVDRIGAGLRAADLRGDRLLAVYLTLGDPLADPVDLAVTVAEAGADVIEIGIPTPSTRPRGADIAASFDRARSCPPERAWDQARALRTRLPDVPVLALVYPSTVADLGADALLATAQESGVDGLVLTDPHGGLSAERVAATGLSAIPLLLPGADPARRRGLESAARHLTYQALAERTGERLDPDRVGDFAAAAAATATTPFLAGFGIRDEHDIRAVAPHAAGVVIGSALCRGVAAAEPPARAAWAAAAVRGWKAATVLSGTELARGGHAR
ncbi:tryptophan synthase subunit alpha [Actinokineospora sp. UTMC 2448]|uniref:tryptophan synthase subunit alpha n=1 Tax=Actinokineospora sp. UTMC 2448 TaxID=2268449 RepID=UPI00216457F0|nr:tryptophan synthase subunit alpha [Actinokineospora sp. UTMC 2448]UVS81495.1 Tryptophan synthase alpha chain [Actinokineospora sp. UTMC 2448]